MSLNMPKGIAVAVVAFTFSLYTEAHPELVVILNLMLVFMLYSLLLSAVINRFSRKFIRIDVKPSEEDKIPHPKLKSKPAPQKPA